MYICVCVMDYIYPIQNPRGNLCLPELISFKQSSLTIHYRLHVNMLQKTE